MIKTLIKYIAAFLLAAALMTAALAASTLIPRQAIEPNMRKSADFLTQSELFGEASEGVMGSKVDRYADSILLNIAWSFDAEHPLRSVLLSKYYFTPYQNENVNLSDAVERGAEANTQYLRYWHGSIALVRPLLTLLPIEGIYTLHTAVLALLAAALVALLARRREWGCALGVLAGMCAATFWLVPRCLEYYWVCALALALSIVVAALGGGEKRRDWGVFFLVAGMATCYLDFLTAETLTLLVPLLLLLRLRRDTEEPPLRLAGRLALAWGCGYVPMWLLKWALASAALGESALPYIAEHVSERIGGETVFASAWQMLGGVLWRNLYCLFPMGWGLAGAILGIALFVALLYYSYVYHGKEWDRRLVAAYAAIACVPYVRFLALRNHSYIHCFFTCRAQMATVLALALIAEELTRREGKPEKRKR